MDDQPDASPRPSETAIRLALHRRIDALDPEAAWALLRWLETVRTAGPRRRRRPAPRTR
jgi:hypothetical protein